MLSFLKSPKSPKAPKLVVSPEKTEETAADPVQQSSPADPDQPASAVSELPKTELEVAPQDNVPSSEEFDIAPSTAASATPSVNADTPASLSPPAESQSPYGKHSDARRFSFRSFSFVNKSNEPKSPHKSVLTTDEEHAKETKVSAAYLKLAHKPRLANSDKRAKESAVIIRSIITGPASGQNLKGTKAVSRTEVGRVKGLLLQPKSANQVITHLRAFDVKENGSVEDDIDSTQFSKPIHAVCLDATDNEVQDRHFKRLNESIPDSADYPSIATASINSVATMFEGMHLINLVTSADLGLGQPGDGEGILAGAVPTAATVINGIQQITPQLMALGYATGKAVTPDHSVVHPPLDRISVFTYWWGLEITLPQPTLSYLDSAKSISSAVINFLSALSLMNEGVREVLPFVRYIGQFIDFEFDSIKKENRGKGVVCAATWIMPAALVPRPWDFPPPLPPKPIVQEAKPDQVASAAPTDDDPSEEEPRSSETSQSVVSQESEAAPPIPSQPPVLPELVVSSPSSADTLGPSPLAI